MMLINQFPISQHSQGNKDSEGGGAVSRSDEISSMGDWRSARTPWQS
jgi:hypothetical protein